MSARFNTLHRHSQLQSQLKQQQSRLSPISSLGASASYSPFPPFAQSLDVLDVPIWQLDNLFLKRAAPITQAALSGRLKRERCVPLFCNCLKSITEKCYYDSVINRDRRVAATNCAPNKRIPRLQHVYKMHCEKIATHIWEADMFKLSWNLAKLKRLFSRKALEILGNVLTIQFCFRRVKYLSVQILRRLMILNLHRHLRVNATTVSTTCCMASNNSLQFGLKLQLHSEALNAFIPPFLCPAAARAGHMRPTRRAPLNANYFISVPIVVLLFSGSVRAHHQKQIIDSSSSRKGGNVAEEEANCCSLSLSVAAFIDFSSSPRPELFIIVKRLRLWLELHNTEKSIQRVELWKGLPRWKCDYNWQEIEVSVMIVLWMSFAVFARSLSLFSYPPSSCTQFVAQWQTKAH